MTNINYKTVINNQAIDLNDIPVLDYPLFVEMNIGLINGNPVRHCVNFFGCQVFEKIKLICCIADDDLHEIFVSSTLVEKGVELESFTARNHNFELVF